jgi:hypothetical protein
VTRQPLEDRQIRHEQAAGGGRRTPRDRREAGAARRQPERGHDQPVLPRLRRSPPWCLCVVASWWARSLWLSLVLLVPSSGQPLGPEASEREREREPPPSAAPRSRHLRPQSSSSCCATRPPTDRASTRSCGRRPAGPARAGAVRSTDLARHQRRPQPAREREGDTKTQPDQNIEKDLTCPFSNSIKNRNSPGRNRRDRQRFCVPIDGVRREIHLCRAEPEYRSLYYCKQKDTRFRTLCLVLLSKGPKVQR